MADEKKTYSVIGTVSIGTDEYRDLIEGLADAEARYSKANSDYWSKYNALSIAEKELKEVKAKYAELCDFIRSDENIATKLKLYRIEKQSKEECK